jgi:hypothetical protein
VITRKRRGANNKVEVVLELDRPDAHRVRLYCDAHDWEPIEMQRPLMRRAGRERGPFRARILLPPDEQAEFRYLVDDNVWVDDQQADGYSPNPFGSLNSVVSAT